MAANNEKSKGQGILETVWVALFVGILLLPLAFTPFRASSLKEMEKRALAPFPSLDNRYIDYPKAIEDWYGDRFGLRGILIGSYRQARYQLGWLNASSSDAIRGLEGWHFLSWGGDSDPILDHTGAIRFSDNELDRLEAYFENWNRWLVDRGIDFYVLIAPNKVSVYPEFLPDGIESGPYGSRVNQLLDRLDSSSVSIVFPLEELKIEKELAGPLYLKLDTHWNGMGAYYSYRAFFERSKLDRPLEEPRIRFVEKLRSEGDLVELLGVQSSRQDKDYGIEMLVENHPRLIGDWRFERGSANRYENSDVDLGKAVIFHDSFMGPLIPLVARHMESSLFVYESQLDQSTIEREDPEVVILECVERLLHGLLEAPLPE
ncbi:MAG: hypothetical protein CBD18_06230 [Opitutales bacterium TMED158]|nr:MAG: hypothetical protein CBD18_06230 [Opitutales bacterium TMED158]